MKRNYHLSDYKFICFFFLISILTACDEGCRRDLSEAWRNAFVIIPSSDSTPSRAYWIVKNLNSGVTTTLSEASNTIRIKAGTNAEISFIGEDTDGGVRAMEISFDGTSTCGTAELGLTFHLDAHTQRANIPELDNLAFRQFVLFNRINLGFCPDNYQWVRGYRAFRGTVENFNGGSTNSILTIEIEPI